MKDWFKYEYGFVNFDEDNFYLTSTGNWSDIKDLKQHEKKITNRLPSKGFIYILLVGVLFSCLFFLNIISGKMSLILLIGLPLAGVAVYNYMKTELGANYVIPYSKVKEITIEGKKISIDLYDLNNLQSKCELVNVSPEGINKMENLKNLVFTFND